MRRECVFWIKACKQTGRRVVKDQHATSKKDNNSPSFYLETCDVHIVSGPEKVQSFTSMTKHKMVNNTSNLHIMLWSGHGSHEGLSLTSQSVCSNRTLDCENFSSRLLSFCFWMFWRKEGKNCRTTFFFITPEILPLLAHVSLDQNLGLGLKIPDHIDWIKASVCQTAHTYCYLYYSLVLFGSFALGLSPCASSNRVWLRGTQLLHVTLA